MSLLVSKPVQVSFIVSQTIRVVTPEFAESYVKTTKCDWGKIFQNRLSHQYPDMKITRKTEKGKEFFTIELKGRPTILADVRLRVHDFLRNNPSMKLSEFKLE